MKYTLLPWLALCLLVVVAGCDLAGADDDSGPVVLQGQVLNTETNNPVVGAFVRVEPYNALQETNEDGRYEMALDVDSTMDLKLTVTKDGFSSATTSVLALAERTISVPVMKIQQVAEETLESGKASNIILLESPEEPIGVKESGSPEVATLTFQLADSLGRPITLDNAAEVSFRFGQHPDGGEFLSPSVVETDNNGKATVNLSAGTKAGVVQVVAESVVDGRALRSQPVGITIHGGLPDGAHFSLGPQQFNFPALDVLGETLPISVLVGDKWSNPVKPGTAVYFSSDAGVIEGSTLTDGAGRGTVNLISGHPKPETSRGIAHVTAKTADDSQNEVSSQIPLVISGAPILDNRLLDAQVDTVYYLVNVDSVTTEQVGVIGFRKTYRLTMDDRHGNPLSAGTSLNITVNGDNVEIYGLTEAKLNDTAFSSNEAPWTWDDVVRGSGITEFTYYVSTESFKLGDSGFYSSEVEQSRVITEPDDALPLFYVYTSQEKAVNADVSSPNGDLKQTIGPLYTVEDAGIVAAPGAVMLEQNAGHIRVTLDR